MNTPLLCGLFLSVYHDSFRLCNCTREIPDLDFSDLLLTKKSKKNSQIEKIIPDLDFFSPFLLK